MNPWLKASIATVVSAVGLGSVVGSVVADPEPLPDVGEPVVLESVTEDLSDGLPTQDRPAEDDDDIVYPDPVEDADDREEAREERREQRRDARDQRRDARDQRRDARDQRRDVRDHAGTSGGDAGATSGAGDDDGAGDDGADNGGDDDGGDDDGGDDD